MSGEQTDGAQIKNCAEEIAQLRAEVKSMREVLCRVLTCVQGISKTASRRVNGDRTPARLHRYMLEATKAHTIPEIISSLRGTWPEADDATLRDRILCALTKGVARGVYVRVNRDRPIRYARAELQPRIQEIGTGQTWSSAVELASVLNLSESVVRRAVESGRTLYGRRFGYVTVAAEGDSGNQSFAS